MHDPLYTPPETAQRLRSTTDTLKYWRHVGAGPAWIRVGRHVLYRESAIEEFLTAAERQPRSA